MSLSASAQIESKESAAKFLIDHTFLHNPQDKKHSCFVNVTYNNEKIISIPVDAVDNTISGVIDAAALAKLGKDKVLVLQQLAQYLLENFGAKQFITMPAGETMPGYILPSDHANFYRLRHAKREALHAATINTLNEYTEIADKLDRELKVILGEEKSSAEGEAYAAEGKLLEKYADFSPTKKEEHRSGRAARFRNSSVQTIRLVSEQKPQLKGLLRILTLGNKTTYLSDETMDQDLVSADLFKGETAELRENNRKRFLLAYLMNKACDYRETLGDSCLIIAAPGTDAEEDVRKLTGVVPLRTKIYEEVGFQSFTKATPAAPVVMMSLSKPGKVLEDVIKKQLLAAAPSLLASARRVSVDKTPAPVAASVVTAAP